MISLTALLAFVVPAAWAKPEVVPQVEKPKPKSLAGFVSWLETRDPAEEYNWWNCGGDCLIGRYQGHCMGRKAGTYGCGYEEYFGTPLAQGPFAAIAMPTPWTVGAALERARKLA